MKKFALTLTTVGLFALSSHGTVILNEPFTYGDGALTSVSAGAWTAHSGGGSQPIQVVSERAAYGVASGGAEDLNRSLGVTNTTGDLYASFIFNFSTLPTATEYFVHFKDETTGNFRCRVFSTTTGAGAGKFRVGVRNGSSDTITNILTDLDLSTDYKLVMRFKGSTNSTIWISPTSESSIVNRADAVILPSNSFNGSSTFALRQAAGMGTLTLDGLLVGTQFSDVQTVGGPPSISGLADISIPASANTGPLPFLVSDVETPVASLNVAATSDNPTLVPNTPANLTFGGSGENRTLTVTPAAGQQGTAGIQVVVTDGNSETATNSFTLTVGEPSISSIADQLAVTNTVSGPIAFSVNDAETTPGSLNVTAISSDQTVLPDSNIGIQNLGGTNRTVTLTNAAPGVTTVTLTVSDGTFSRNTIFKLTAYPDVGLVLGDSFSYPDGSVITNSGFFWDVYSAGTGDTGQTQVATGKLNLSASQSEDIRAFLTNAPYADTGGFVFYSRFIVNFSALPTASGTGEYFAYFKDFGTSQFRARIFSSTNSAAHGKFRLAIGNGGFPPVQFPMDLSTNTSYVVISRYNVATAANSTLWVNPISESSPSATATDITTPVTIYTYAFRQNTGIGVLAVDDLLIGTSFSSVLTNLAPTPESIQFQIVNGELILNWVNPQWNLQSATDVSGPYANITGATSPYTNVVSGSKFFRLIY